MTAPLFLTGRVTFNVAGVAPNMVILHFLNRNDVSIATPPKIKKKFKNIFLFEKRIKKRKVQSRLPVP